MSGDTQDRPKGKGDALPDDILRKIVGGARPDEAQPLDGDRAIALTVGAEHAEATIKVAGEQAKVLTPEEAKAKADADAEKALLAEFRDIKGKGLKAGDGIAGNYVKTSTETNDLGSGDDWKSKTTTKAQDEAKTAADKVKAADEKQQDEHRAALLAKASELDKDNRTQQAAQAKAQTLQNAQSEAKDAFGQVVKAQHDAAKEGPALRSAQHNAELAQQLHDTGLSTVNTYKALVAEAEKGKDTARTAQLQSALKAAEQDHAGHVETLQHYTARAEALKAELAKKAGEASPADHAAQANLAKARGEAGDEGRARSNSAPSPSTAEKPATAHGAATEGDAAKGHDVSTEVMKKIQEADAARKVAEAQKKQDEEAKKRFEGYQRAAGIADKIGTEILNEMARNDAKANGLYSSSTTVTTEGGLHSQAVKDIDGDDAMLHSLDQTTVKQGTESWNSAYGSGAKAEYTARVEVGDELVHETKDENGNTVTDTDRTYASAEFKNKAGYSLTSNAFNAEASTTVTVHAEASTSHTSTVLGFENTVTTTVAAHGTAGAKVGAHIGFDGASLVAKASAEVSVSATVSDAVTVGKGKAEVSATVYAQAAASAKAEAVVTFNPETGNFQAKAGAGAEASLGVGVDVEGGLHSEHGNGVGATAHIKVGAVGGHFEPEVSIENGKVDVKLKLGVYVGYGATYDINIKGNYKQAADNVSKSVDELKEHPLSIFEPGSLFTRFVAPAWNGFFS